MSDGQVIVLVHDFRRAPRADQARGLLGWMALTINELLRVDGVTLRRTSAGRLYVLFPERRDERGHVHRTVWPVQPWARREIERQILAQLAERAASKQQVVGT